jgi:hypothetical protein
VETIIIAVSRKLTSKDYSRALRTGENKMAEGASFILKIFLGWVYCIPITLNNGIISLLAKDLFNGKHLK